MAAPNTQAVTINHKSPAMQDPRVRRAIALALDRQAFMASEHGDARLGGIMSSPPEGRWGLTPEQLQAAPGYGGSAEKKRAEARKLMEGAGYGPSKKLPLAFPVRALPRFVQMMTLVADQLRAIYIEGDIDPKEVSVMQGLLMKGAFALTFNAMASHFDDPDIVLYEHYSCKSMRNRSGFCNSDIEAKIHEQSGILDPLNAQAAGAGDRSAAAAEPGPYTAVPDCNRPGKK